MMPVQLRAALRALRSQPATCGLASVAGREPLLFTPGPLTTSISVKQAMLRDLGSRDPQFIELVRSVRSELLTLADTSQEAGYECVLVPGSGTTTVESVARAVSPAAVAAHLAAKPAGYYGHAAMIHHETTAGTLNDVDAVGKLLHAHDPELTFIVDSMSGFGCYAWEGLEGNGQFRFTPPVQSLMAFKQALAEMFAEGGVAGRRARYEANAAALGCIIHTYLFPDDPNFDFPKFYDRLAELGIVIYPGKLTEADCFRVGSIGRMFERDMVHLTSSVKIALEEQGVALPVAQIDAPLPEPTRVAA
ncbi:serine-pyruvate transaminase [Aureococcus anophagefferens]|nr:serine-pyruvate transaminase [Aureococcus anophagefferens]